jgi:hypothetical protein
MKTPSDGWDRDERELLQSEGLGAELEAIRVRHALAPEDESRLLERIHEEARRSGTRRAGRSWRWGLLTAAAVGLVAVGTTWIFRRAERAALEGIKPPEPTVAVATPPVFYLALEKPDLKVSPSALEWRGPRGENRLLADLKPAFDAFRAGDYPRADREFSALSGTYPQSVEIALYQGVARLFVGDIAGAMTSLTAAERVADRSLAWDVGWYRAVAEERAGNPAAARARLTGLCAQPDARARTACDALARFPSGRSPAP